jgi:apolipoprotein N-acyltransferase
VLGNLKKSTEATLRVGIVQPNIDPFEKWGANVDPQISILQRLTVDVSRQRTDLVLWPETAIPFYALLPENRRYLEQIRRQVDSLGIHLLTGVPDAVYYRQGGEIPKSSKTSVTGERYDTFNSSLLLQPGSEEIQKYAKMLLVPFAERVPFSEALSFLNAMHWNFGMGGWNSGKQATLFTLRSGVKFSNLICYESAYPGFVADFVRQGAQFLTVITNDSWWGNTSGAYQHKQFGVLRAIENRRWIVQCANGGISCFIDPFGHILHPTKMFTQTVLAETIEPGTELTFYSRHGDWLAELCGVLSLFCLAAALGRKFYGNIRTRQLNEAD